MLFRFLFSKACDFTFVVSPGALFWLYGMYISLWVDIPLPFSIQMAVVLQASSIAGENGKEFV
jgi:hypothetical protein